MKQLDTNVTTAGTAEEISPTSLQVRSAVIQAKKDNTGSIYIGSSEVDNSGNKGTFLNAGEAYTLAQDGTDELYNLNEVFIDADVSGEGVTVTYFIR